MGAAPYDFHTRKCGCLEYYDGEQYMGSVPVYVVLQGRTSKDTFSMEAKMSNVRLIKMLEEKQKEFEK